MPRRRRLANSPNIPCSAIDAGVHEGSLVQDRCRRPAANAAPPSVEGERQMDPDVIDTLAGLAAESPVASIRDRKPVTREQAQASYRALFEPTEPGDITQ